MSYAQTQTSCNNEKLTHTLRSMKRLYFVMNRNLKKLS